MIDCQSDPVEEGLLLRESHRRISAAEQVSRGANAARGRADRIERSCAQGGAAVNPFRAVLPWRSVQRLTPVAETQSQVLVQIRFGVDFAHGAVNVVGDSPKLDGLFVIHDITTARVTVTRLSHAADVDHPTLVAVGYAVPGIGINRPNEAKILGKNAWHMRVTLKADSRHHGKQLFHFLDVLRVFGNTYSLVGPRGEPCTNSAVPSSIMRGRLQMYCIRARLASGPSCPPSIWARVQKIACSAATLNPSGSNRALLS